MRISKATETVIAEGAAVLRSGGLVAFPTETVYGLGADATQGEAVARVFEAKGRPRFNPLIVHIADAEAARRLAVFDERAGRLAAAFWPGPLTLVLPRRADCPVCDLATAGLDTIAIRVPAHPVARALITATGRPVVAPSANRSGHVSATTAAHVAADLGERVALIIDDGPARHGIESTVVAVDQGRLVLLRPGALPVVALEPVAGEAIDRAPPLSYDEAGPGSSSGRQRPRSPGQLVTHYAPRARVRLDAAAAGPGEALLAFGPTPVPHSGLMLNLSPRADVVEAAANLFDMLRRLDASGPAAIAVMTIPDQGLGEAINDRLRRAAAPR